MNLRQLEAFRMVMETGSVTQAGKLLYISQPAVSRLIADLEEHVNFRLFDRRKKRLIPTVEAKLLYNEVEKAFVGMGRIEDTAQSIRSLKRGHLRLLAMPGIATLLMPRVIAEFNQQFPDITIELESRPRLQVVEWIGSRQYDLGFIDLPFEGVDVTVHADYCVEMVCVVPRTHRLAAATSVAASELKGEPFISYPKGTHIRFVVDQVFEQPAVHRQLKVETRASETILNMVDAGLGIAVVPRFGQQSLGGETLRFLPFEPSVTLEIGALVSANKHQSITATHFLETFRSFMDASENS